VPYDQVMKFIAVVLAYFVMALVLAWGILQAVHGHYWLLGVGVLAYVLTFAKLGCLPPDGSH
jgi:hypothetical protein